MKCHSQLATGSTCTTGCSESLTFVPAFQLQARERLADVFGDFRESRGCVSSESSLKCPEWMRLCSLLSLIGNLPRISSVGNRTSIDGSAPCGIAIRMCVESGASNSSPEVLHTFISCFGDVWPQISRNWSEICRDAGVALPVTYLRRIPSMAAKLLLFQTTVRARSTCQFIRAKTVRTGETLSPGGLGACGAVVALDLNRVSPSGFTGVISSYIGEPSGVSTALTKDVLASLRSRGMVALSGEIVLSPPSYPSVKPPALQDGFFDVPMRS